MDRVISEHLAISEERLAALCQKWHVSEMAVFGSALRDDFGADSDIDLLVTFSGGYSLDILLDMTEELQSLLGRTVDLVVKQNIERDANYLRRKYILESARVVYASR